ncbi:MAG: hypothetical protein V4722_22675 [Bacteroidota bacterium]
MFRQTNPTIDGVPLYSFDGEYTTWNLDDYDEILYEKLLALVVILRDKQFDVSLSNVEEFGRILCFETCRTTHDGAPIIASDYFVDEGDVPPIDTWFYLKKGYYHAGYLSGQTLFCWIPKGFETVMQEAMDVEIFGSYVWLDENDTYMSNIIKRKM